MSTYSDLDSDDETSEAHAQRRVRFLLDHALRNADLGDLNVNRLSDLWVQLIPIVSGPGTSEISNSALFLHGTVHDDPNKTPIRPMCWICEPISSEIGGTEGDPLSDIARELVTRYFNPFWGRDKMLFKKMMDNMIIAVAEIETAMTAHRMGHQPALDSRRVKIILMCPLDREFLVSLEPLYPHRFAFARFHDVLEAAGPTPWAPDVIVCSRKVQLFCANDEVAGSATVSDELMRSIVGRGCEYVRRGLHHGWEVLRQYHLKTAFPPVSPKTTKPPVLVANENAQQAVLPLDVDDSESSHSEEDNMNDARRLSIEDDGL